MEVFDQAAATARSSGDVAALHDALQLWTGPLLPEDQYADWAIEHRERLTETHAAVATLLASKLFEQGHQKRPLPSSNHSSHSGPSTNMCTEH